MGVLGVHGAAVEDAYVLRERAAVKLAADLADRADGAVGFLIGSGLAGADRPDGLVSYYDLRRVIRVDPRERALDLGCEELVRNARLALLERFADADDGG